MSALAGLPDLLHRIDALDTGTTLCRRRGCFAEAYRWLSPYCEPACAPRVGLQGPTIRSLIADAFDALERLVPLPAELTFDMNRYALQLEHRLWHGAAAQLSPSPSALLWGIGVC